MPAVPFAPRNYSLPEWYIIFVHPKRPKGVAMKKLGVAALLLAGLLFALPTGSSECSCEQCDQCQCGDDCQCTCECGEVCQCGDACECQCACDGESPCGKSSGPVSRCGGMNSVSCGGCGR